VSDEFNSPRSEPVVGALLEEWAVIEDLLGGLDVTEWPTSTALPGWTVHDVVAHLIGTESRLAGDEEPPASIDVTTLDHVRNATGAANEHCVRALHPEPPEAMLLRFHDVTRRRAESLSAISPEEFDAATQTPVCIAPYRRFMEIRVFDCWPATARGRRRRDHRVRRGIRRAWNARHPTAPGGTPELLTPVKWRAHICVIMWLSEPPFGRRK
jgi:uncharacterized protein (TIGR03083 family)